MTSQRNATLRTLIALFTALGLSFGMTACNTIGGAGKDVEAAGEAVQDASQDVSDSLDD